MPKKFDAFKRASEDALEALLPSAGDTSLPIGENAGSADSDAPIASPWICRYCKCGNPGLGEKFCGHCGKSKLPEGRVTIHNVSPAKNAEDMRSRRLNIMMTPRMYDGISTLAIVRQTSLNNLIFDIINKELSDNAELIKNYAFFRKENDL